MVPFFGGVARRRLAATPALPRQGFAPSSHGIAPAVNPLRHQES